MAELNKNNWNSLPLADVVHKWYGGSTPSRLKREYYSNKKGIPWVRVGDIKGKEIFETEEYLTEDGAAIFRNLIPEGAVLLSTSGTIGKVAIAGTSMAMNQAVQAIVFDEALVLPEYAYFYFRFFAPWLLEMSNAVTIPNLTRSRLKDVYIPFPIIDEQRYIVKQLNIAENIIIKQHEISEGFKSYLTNVFVHMFQQYMNPHYYRPLEELTVEPILSGLRERQAQTPAEIPPNKFVRRRTGFEGY